LEDAQLSHQLDEKVDLGVIRRELFTAVVGDVMDTMDLTTQFLPPRIRPIDPAMVVLGRAMPVVEADVDPEQPADRPFGLMLQALDDLKDGEVYICSGSVKHYALWGELMSLRANHLGAAGAVVDGYSRDTRSIQRMEFPTFSFGSYGQDQGVRGQVVDFRVPITIGDIQVDPGDYVFGDVDGVCIVPRAAAQEVFERSLEKVRQENLVRKAIGEGMRAGEAFDTYGVM
jgi:regulator of RNase E activity RraA